MTNSIVSEYENISVKDICSESLLYQAINNVLSITTTNGNKIFCPLCIKTYEFKYDLLGHLKRDHFNFLCRTIEQSYLHEECPFCYANFFGRHTVVKHALHNHAKVIAHLYLQTGNDKEICFFCGDEHNKKCVSEFVSHIEQKHLLKFAVLFEEQFMNVNDSLSFIKDADINPSNENILNASKSKPEKCFDFSHLKEQLHNVELSQLGLKSILKTSRAEVNAHSSKKIKACRILQFDTPDENIQRSVLIQNINSPKQISFAEHSLLCFNNKREQEELFNRCPNKPLHCSTPIIQQNKCDSGNKNKFKSSKFKKRKPTFKSYFYKNDFAFQCGKCAKHFTDNTELNLHIKKKHKMFILDLLHPCYQCAICKAKFYKNYYLKKHIKLHSCSKKSYKFI